MLVEVCAQGWQAYVITYIAAISAPVSSAQRQRFLEQIIEMRSQRLQAYVITCSAAISAFVTSKNTQLRASRS